MKRLVLILSLIIHGCYLSGQQTNYPSRVGWVNVKSYGATGDGVTDDTKAVQKAIRTYPQQYLTRIVVFFPDGIYLVSDTLKYLNGYYDCGVTLQGQSVEGTVIRLADNAPGYNDPANPKPLIYTRSGNQSFNQYIFNMTINTGENNPGVTAIDYVTNNLGAIKNVKIISEDGKGYCGLFMERSWPGPGLITNVTIYGYKYGISMAKREYSMTFENITLINQTVCGFKNTGNEAAIRKLTSINSVPVIINSGQIVLMEGNFTGGSAGTNAIINSDFIYLRNIKSSGYRNILTNGYDSIETEIITEYCNKQPQILYPYQGGLSLNLPIKETPEYYNNDTTQWANVKDYGAKAVDLLYASFDATNGIRKAFRSGKAVVYFPPKGSNGSSYHIYDTITIPASVKMIIGFDFASISKHNSGNLIVKEDSPDPLFFERIALSVTNLSKRTVVMKHMKCSYDNGPNSGDLYVEDIVGQITPTYAMNMWARQLNTEMQSEKDFDVINRGGLYWILGQKTEGHAVINKTEAGGYSEILGGLMYPASSFYATDSASAAFISENGCISSIMTKSSYVTNGIYPVYAREIRNTTGKELKTSEIDSYSVLYRGGCTPDYFAVSITRPENNASFGTMQTITINSTVFGPYTESAKVEIYEGSNKISGTLSSPFTFNWGNVSAGKHYIYARASYQGDTTYSATITLYVLTESICYGSGSITMEKWTNLASGGINTIPLLTAPAVTQTLNLFEIPPSGQKNYGVRVIGYVCPPFTGIYRFFISGDDFGQLWLSPDDKAANKTQVAYVPDWTNPREWDKYSSQTSTGIALATGQKYYIEALMKQNQGGDNLAIGWQLPDGSYERPIPGLRLLSSILNDVKKLTVSGITVYPNPSTGIINVSISDPFDNDCIIEIFDNLGILVKRESVKKRINHTQYDISEFPAGLYILKLITCRGIYHYKMIKE